MGVRLGSIFGPGALHEAVVKGPANLAGIRSSVVPSGLDAGETGANLPSSFRPWIALMSLFAETTS